MKGVTTSKLERLHKTWESLSQDDPLWAILTDGSKSGGQWDLRGFLATGEEEIATVMHYVEQHVSVDFGSEALDFGCGIGRLTRPLGRRFVHAHGVDISERMISTAQSIDAPKCSFFVNREPNLARVPNQKFGFIYSNITLQHMAPRLALGYIREFVRLLAPSGVLVFQVAERQCGGLLAQLRYHSRLRTRLKILLGHELMQVYFLSEQQISAALQPLRVLDKQITNAHLPGFNGNLQFLAKPPTQGHLSRQYLAFRQS